MDMLFNLVRKYYTGSGERELVISRFKAHGANTSDRSMSFLEQTLVELFNHD